MLGEFKARRRALQRTQFEALREALLGSPLVGHSTLGGTFAASRGFAVIFRHEGVARVLERFPQLAPHLAATLGEPAVRALTPWWRGRHASVPNAWYLNLLVVPEGAAVARHLDVTLREVSGMQDALPEVVSVLYLTVPQAVGGELRLSRPGADARYVSPRENLLVHFRGDLAHEVCPFFGAPQASRASLVIEQYHFAPLPLGRVPEFQLESRAGFSAYLRHHAGRPGTTFTIDR